MINSFYSKSEVSHGKQYIPIRKIYKRLIRELIECSILLYGDDIRSQLKTPGFSELCTDVKRHYESIKKYVQKTERNFYSFGWMLDIARCIYTLRTGKIIAKTLAAEWAPENNLCPDSDVLGNALKVRVKPLENNDEQIQRFADVLKKELSCL